VRSATDLTLPAIIASVTASADFISLLLPSRLRQVSGPAFVNVQNSWLSDDVSFHLSAVHSHHGTGPIVTLKFDNVMSAAQFAVGRDRLPAVASPHSGDF